MNSDRLKKLAGILTEAKKVVPEDPTYRLDVGTVKLRHEVEFMRTAKKHGGTPRLKDVSGHQSGDVTFTEDTLAASKDKADAFKTAWESIKFGNKVQESEAQYSIVESKYIVKHRLQGSEGDIVFDELKIGARSIQQDGSKSFPMTKFEYETFKSLEDAGDKKDVTASKEYVITETGDTTELDEAHKTLPAIDRDEYPDVKGLEGPTRMKSGRVVYYDPKEGKYYDKKTDMYLSNEDAEHMREGVAPIDDNSVDGDVEKLDRMGIKHEREISVKDFKKVKNSVTKRIKELEDAIKKYDEKGYNDTSLKQQAIDSLNQILDDLKSEDWEGLKKAQIYFGTLMNPLTDLFPAQVVNFIVKGVL